MNPAPVPLVVIGGFLGAGKTTLINNLLTNPEGRRLAVIVNDIGQVNIDDDLIKNSREDRIALTNGCICCSLNSELFEAVTQLATGDHPYDVIVVEASGISDPVTLIGSIQLLESASLVRAETVVYIIDASSFDALEFEEAERVFDYAALSDLILINKQDLAKQCQTDYIIDQLGICAPDGLIHLTLQAEVPAAVLFAPVETNLLRQSSTSRDIDQDIQNHDYVEFSLFSTDPVDKNRFENFIRETSVYSWRAKGFVRFTADPASLYLLNRVGSRATLEKLGDLSNIRDSQTTRIVVVGRRGELDRSNVSEAFNACLGFKI